MSSDIFLKKIRGQVPSHKIYEDDLTFVFLDERPLTKGHLLVIPKEQIDHLDDCSDKLYTAIFKTVRRMSLMLKRTFNPKRIALVVHGTEVPHAHVHVVPLYTGKELQLAAKERLQPTTEEFTVVAKQILQHTNL